MSVVTLVSGGIDSSLMSVLATREGLEILPLFIDYGQHARRKEMQACRRVHHSHRLPAPAVMDLSGFGGLIPSGLTNRTKDILDDAFLPCRNLLFLVVGAAYASAKNASAVAIGLLNEETHLFPDQTREFLKKAGDVVACAVGRRMSLVAPLMSYYKSDVLRLAKRYGIEGTYSCHSGRDEPCGRCVSCREIAQAR